MPILGIFLRAIGRLPLAFRARLGRLLGYLFYLVPTRDRRIAKLQMDLFVKDQGGSRNLPGVYAAMGETALECLNLSPILNDYRNYVDADWPYVQRLKASKRGILILSAHLGNWDLSAAVTVKEGFEASAIGKAAKSSGLQQVLASIRDSYKINMIWRTGKGGIKQIIERLQRGELVGAVIDQDTRVSSMMVPFFGYPAATPSSIVEIGKRANALIVGAFLVRTALTRYHMHVCEFDPALPTAEILAQFNQTLESMIRQYPTQWVWFHKRWRSRGDNLKLSSKEYIELLESGFKTAISSPPPSLSVSKGDE